MSTKNQILEKNELSSKNQAQNNENKNSINNTANNNSKNTNTNTIANTNTKNHTPLKENQTQKNNEASNKNISNNNTKLTNSKNSITNEFKPLNENTESTKNTEFKPLNENTQDSRSTEFKPYIEKTKSTAFETFSLCFIILLIIVLSIFIVFTIININNKNIINGVSINGIDVSGMNVEEARETLQNAITKNIPEEIKLKHGDYETSIPTEPLEISFDINTAINSAYQIGRNGNIFQNNFTIIKNYFTETNIDLNLTLNEEVLKTSLSDISAKLPDTVIQSSYYMEGNNLILTKGRTGYVVNVDETANTIITDIQNFNIKDNQIEISTLEESPQALDIDAIHSEIYKQPSDAYFTQNPYAVYPSENGLDFAISVDEAKAMLQEEKDEYIIPLQTLYPNVTTNMIGQEAFPDLLSSYSTNYSTRDRDRTTNLILAANKINGTVLMPGETFSYNTVVGERTIAAGYKEAPIYVSGEVVDGLGGGICQITTTLYNAVVYANLEIVERSNHQFVPSYSNPSRDATVVYGSIDFKFKNNRNYPIKISCSVSNGIAAFQIYGLKTADDYEVEISSRITSQNANYTNSEAYKILKKNGQVVSTTLLSRDTYKRH